MYDEFNEIKAMSKEIKKLVIVVASGDGDVIFDSITEIGNDLGIIMDNACRIAVEAERQRAIASKLRKEFGSQLSDMCDAAEME